MALIDEEIGLETIISLAVKSVTSPLARERKISPLLITPCNFFISSTTKTIPNISLTLMGPGDSEWLIELVKELGLGQYVRILPSRNDIPACIAAADMIIHPSLADSFSQLVIEAQAVGGLLVASDIAAVREQIIDGVTGVIFSPRDSGAIAAAVIQLVNNPALAASIRKKAPYHVREKFSWQRMVQEEIECLTRFVK